VETLAMLGSVKYLAEAGAASATYYETTGLRGVMGTEPGEVFPLYHAPADIGEFAGGEVRRTVSSDPLRFEGLLLRKRMLDEHSVEGAMRNPEAVRRQSGSLRGLTADGVLTVSLLPYAAAKIDPA
jgi:hypothetical protein